MYKIQINVNNLKHNSQEAYNEEGFGFEENTKEDFFVKYFFSNFYKVYFDLFFLKLSLKYGGKLSKFTFSFCFLLLLILPSFLCIQFL